MLVLEWKERAFIEKVNSRCFCWFPAAILVHQNGTPIWRLHTKFYKGAWNLSANDSETVGHKGLRLGQTVHILVFYNNPFSLLLPLDDFQFIFCCVTVKTIFIQKLTCRSSCTLIGQRIFYMRNENMDRPWTWRRDSGKLFVFLCLSWVMFQKDFAGNGLLNFLFVLLYVKKKKKISTEKEGKET